MRAVIAAIAGGARANVSADAARLARKAKLPGPVRPDVETEGTSALIRVSATPGPTAPPSPDRRLPVAVVVDGTVDNRRELARELDLPLEADTQTVVAAAYGRWEEECANRLVGELAFVLWDARQRRLFAARDALGLRQLFYTERPDGTLLLASQLPMLLDSPSVSDLDEEYVADFLATQVHVGPATAFRGVRRLQAGHWLSWHDGRLETRRYWAPTEQPPLEHADAGEAAEHFRDVFAEAVDRCLDTGGRTWAELSGGLDSSSIVCVAQEVLRRRPERANGFATVSLVWDETPQSDERRWMQAVLDRYEIDNVRLVCDDLFFDGVLEAARYRSDPHFGLLCHPMYWREGEHLRQAGVETLLSGARAESVVLSDLTPPLHLADHLRAGRFGVFWRELSRWQEGTHKPLLNLAWSFGLRPLLRRDLFLRSSEDQGVVDPWVAPDFARRLDLRNRSRGSLLSPRFRSRAQGMQAERLLRSEQMITRGSLEWSCEIRHPFLYRPLVELALRIPWEQKVEPDMAKPLLRRALGETLPALVRTRKGARGPGPSAYKAFARRWPQIEPVVRAPLLASLGYVDAAEFYRAAEMIRFGASPKFGAFTTCLGLEYWLRAMTGVETP